MSPVGSAAAGLAPAAPAPPAGWRVLWSTARARRWVVAAVVAAWLPALGIPFRHWLDFGAFYAAGHLVFSPAAAQLDPVVLWQEAHGLPLTPFVYPAWTALLAAPLAALPLDLAGLLNMLLGIAALVASALLGARLFHVPRRMALLGTFAWAPAAAAVLSGQNTAFALLLILVAAWALESGRPLLAGTATALLGYKPQLFAPVAGTLGWRGAWRTLAIVAAGLGVQYGLGVVATGGDWTWPATWLSTVAAYTGPDFAANGWQAISLPAILGRVTLGGGAPGAFTLPAMAGYILGLPIILRALPTLRDWAAAPALALGCALGLIVNPHAWVYDATMLLPALALFAADAAGRGWPWRDRWMVACAYAIALTWPVDHVIGVQPLVLVVILVPFALLGWRPFRPHAA